VGADVLLGHVAGARDDLGAGGRRAEQQQRGGDERDAGHA
jgi:hypothetical protein